MKLNKKLLMAALAGAIVVGGGVSTYAEEASNQFTSPEYKATTKEEKDKELAAAKKAALAKLDRLGITSDMIKKQINSAKTSAGVDSLVETVVKSTGKAEKEETEETPKYNNLFDKHELGGLGGDKGPGRFDEFGWESNEHGYDTRENAEKAAKKALKNDPINNSYSIRQGADGRYYYVLSTVEAEKPEENPSNPSTPSTPGRQPSTPEGPYAPYEPSTPGKEDKKPGEDKKPETKKPEDKKPGETKKPEDKKPGENKKPEDKKPETKKPGKKENTDSPNKKNKKKLPKAGSEAEILTLAAASLSSVAGAFISLKKRK